MCGIFCYISLDGNQCESFDEIYMMLDRRGPDSTEICNFSTSSQNLQKIYLSLRGSVLGMQSPLTPQPVRRKENYLLFNGEIYDGLDVNENQNDSYVLSEFLNAHFDGTFFSLSSILGSINGEFSLIYFHKFSNSIWLCRDKIGRRSLLINKDSSSNICLESPIIISSVACFKINKTWMEVPAGFLYKIDLNSVSNVLTKYPFNLFQDAQFLSMHLSNENEICNKFLEILKTAIELRINNSGIIQKDCISLLFSGGIDCTLIATIISKSIKSDLTVELINVAFYNSNLLPSDSIDRKSAVEVFKWLGETFLNMKFLFIQVDVSLEDLQNLREKRIKNVIYPKDTNLDNCLGCPLWFACRGYGSYTIHTGNGLECKSSEYTCSSRIVISGLGADEILCGYDRHFEIYAKHGERGLNMEMIKDIQNLQSRNLGRDDRCCSDHGKELRFPYLDENLIKYCLRIPKKMLIDLNMPRGIGNKLILRKSAELLGIPHFICYRPKKALQFGSQFTKIEKSGLSMNKKSDKLLIME